MVASISAIAPLTTPYLSADLTDPVKKGNTYSINTHSGNVRIVQFQIRRPRLDHDDASRSRRILR